MPGRYSKPITPQVRRQIIELAKLRFTVREIRVRIKYVINEKYIATIISNARHDGEVIPYKSDPYENTEHQTKVDLRTVTERKLDFTFQLEPAERTYFRQEAALRDITERELFKRLFAIITQYKMIENILDDKSDA